MASTAADMPPASASNTNGVLTAPSKGIVGGNRKKQKRRAKQAAKQAAHGSNPSAESTDVHPEYDEDPLGYAGEEYDYSDGETDAYPHQYSPAHPVSNGVHETHPGMNAKKKNKKKKSLGQQGGHGHHNTYDAGILPPMPAVPHPSMATVRPPAKNSQAQQRNIWNTSTQQERTNIKNFWLSLTEEDRKALLKIEKEAVLKKMKQQQKSSCSCTVCGRKRTAIEEELEVLYEGYYEELEQYAHHDHSPLPSVNGMIPDPLQHRRPHPLAAPPPSMPQHHKPSHMHEHLDEEEYSDEKEYSDEDDYSDEDLDAEPEPHRPPQGVPDFFNFGSHLTVKGILTPWPEQLRDLLKLTSDNLLTVADDLLKNDGRKFIEMMEQLAERRMQRESRTQYEAENHPGYPPDDPAYNHDDSLATGDDFDDDEGSYDSQEEYDDDLDDEDEMVGNLQMASARATFMTDYLQGGLTEEQRMQEGRRMFQIFAARMFEQRVLTAYREKVAKERQEQLLQDLLNEEEREKAKEAKKQRDAQKKKDKKKQQQQAKAEEKARREAEKAEEEARLRQVEEQKQEEQRRKKEEQRKKREEEKRKQDEEKARKEAERLRRQQEEQQKREEAERKARETKAAEKARKEEARKREREEREAREREAKDRKMQEDKDRRERDAKTKADREARELQRGPAPTAQSLPTSQQPAQIAKRPSQIGMVAVPGVFPKPTPGSGISSPHPTVATPALPKVLTPSRPRQPSQQNSLPSSPRQAQPPIPNQTSRASPPGLANAPLPQPKTILQKTNSAQPSQPHMVPPPSTNQSISQQIMPPPGMSLHQHAGAFGGMHTMGFGGYQGPPGPMHSQMGQPRGSLPMFPQHVSPMGIPGRMSFNAPNNGMPGFPPMSMSPAGRNFGFDAPTTSPPPPGFAPQPHMPSHTSPIGSTTPNLAGGESARNTLPIHSRQQSTSEKDRFESAAHQPIARPAPIQRPSSVKPGHDRRGLGDVDDLSQHLGSSALLDDEDLSPGMDDRRHSNVQSGHRHVSGPPGIPPIGFGPPTNGFGPPANSWGTPNLSFGQGPGWGSLPSPGPNMSIGGWGGPASVTTPSGSFGGSPNSLMHGLPAGVPLSRPRAIRIAICQACRHLSSRGNGSNDQAYHDLETVMRQIEFSRALPADAPATLNEVVALCSTEGDHLNGGGELTLRKDPHAPHDNAPANAYAVKWDSGQSGHEASLPVGGAAGRGSLGEIGSPMPSRTSPTVAPGFGKMGGTSRVIGGLGSFSGGSAQHSQPGVFQNLGAVGEGSA